MNELYFVRRRREVLLPADLYPFDELPEVQRVLVRMFGLPVRVIFNSAFLLSHLAFVVDT
jgi:hypothetical protein